MTFLAGKRCKSVLLKAAREVDDLQDRCFMCRQIYLQQVQHTANRRGYEGMRGLATARRNTGPEMFHLRLIDPLVMIVGGGGGGGGGEGEKNR
jgi:hypothetical protein